MHDFQGFKTLGPANKLRVISQWLGVLRLIYCDIDVVTLQNGDSHGNEN